MPEGRFSAQTSPPALWGATLFGEEAVQRRWWSGMLTCGMQFLVRMEFLLRMETNMESTTTWSSGGGGGSVTLNLFV